jgi:2-polyprenyl-3-methyl-5-hydroxy-6-metoxy-1,4-benzoquinol methylase
VSSPSLEDLLARLERERVEADRLYNDALTAVDRAIQSAPALPGHPPPYDAAKVEAINQSWDILPAGSPAIDRSLRGRLRGFIWRLIGPSLETQKQFNAALVEHLNRNVSAHEESQRATAALIDAAREQFQALTRFESLLVQYLQTVTLYVDTKDRAAGGNELRERITLIEQRIAAMKRALDAEAASAHGASASRAPRAESVFSTDLDSVTYVGFEDKFRGSQADIRSRIEDYVTMFASASNVLDVGCGRGELLDLLRSRGVSARGIDVNRAMVDICRERGLAVEQADAVSYLGGQADASLGGLIALQVVEHFEPAYLLHFLELDGVLRNLHSRSHASAAASSGHAAVSRPGQRLHERRCAVSRAGHGGRSPRPHRPRHDDRRPGRTRAGGRRRQCPRRQTEREAVLVDGLRGHREAVGNPTIS